MMADEQTPDTPAEPDQESTPEPTPDPKAKAESTPDPAPEPTNWRDSIQGEDLRKVAERFNSPTDAIKSIVDLRKRESTPRVPGKDSTDEDRAAYRKAIGVPESPEGYAFSLPDGRDPTDDEKSFQSHFSKVFHGAEISASQADTLNKAWNEYAAQVADEIAQADAKFAEESSAALKAEWGSDMERNTTLANRAATEMLGEDFENASKIETKDGRFLLDHPVILKMFAKIGGEMNEGSLGPTLASSDVASINEQIEEIQTKKMKAMGRMDQSEAKRLDAEQAKLYEKLYGNEAIVGSEGRTS